MTATSVRSWGVVLSTIRPLECIPLLRELAGEELAPAEVILVVQGSCASADELRYVVAREGLSRPAQRVRVLFDEGRGLSRGRNIGFHAIADSVEWVWTPNDSSRIGTGWSAGLTSALDTHGAVDAIALNYLVGGAKRRSVAEWQQLRGWNVWRAIEPAVIWRRAFVLAAGGFDEALGTGCPTWAQSGEGTDLLARASGAVVTAPVDVVGLSQHARSGSRTSRVRKEFFYGVGFGVVCRRHFAGPRSLLAVLTPAVRLLRGQGIEGEHVDVALTAATMLGRLLGLVLGERATHKRMRGGWG